MQNSSDSTVLECSLTSRARIIASQVKDTRFVLADYADRTTNEIAVKRNRLKCRETRYTNASRLLQAVQLFYLT
jgi:hypothetical protein